MAGVKCTRSRLLVYLVGIVVLVVLWGGVLIPTIFFVLPESKSSLNRSTATSLLEECRASNKTKFCESLTSDEDSAALCFVLNNLDHGGMVEELRALTVSLKNCSAFSFDFMKHYGIVLQYCLLFSGVWFLCYSLNIYMVIVHNKRHIILGNRRTHCIQSVVCWLLPTIRLIIQFSNPSQDRYFTWIITDYFLCIPTDGKQLYYSLALPSQLITGIGATLLIYTVIFLLLQEQDMSGIKILQDASKLSGITSLGKRLGALTFAFVVVGIYFPSTLTFMKMTIQQKQENIALFVACKQARTDCDDISLLQEFPMTPLMISLHIIAALFVLSVSFLFIGTPAQIKLWKSWVARLFLFCLVPDPDGKYESWKDDPDLKRYRLSARSARRMQVLQQAKMARREATPGKETEMVDI